MHRLLDRLDRYELCLHARRLEESRDPVIFAGTRQWALCKRIANPFAA
jgi:hypothetical protein